MQYNFPFTIDKTGKIGTTDEQNHIRQMIEQVLFTTPGERVNRPNFGCGINQLVFAQASEEISAANNFLIQGALQQWLGDIIQIDSVIVNTNDSQLNITVRYQLRITQQTIEENFSGVQY